MLACPQCRASFTSDVAFCGIDGARLVEVSADPMLGQLIDRYRIVEMTGRGATGFVYRARHTALERDFAVKVLFGDFAADRTYVARFAREAQALSSLRHTHVVSVVDFGTTPAGITYLVMEYVEGQTLAELIQREAPLAPWRAARIVRQTAAGLMEAHRLGMTHRDVKPANIVLVAEGGEEVVKLVDFGIVAVDDSLSSTKLTITGRIQGTPVYMAPEVLEGQVGAAADLYSLGAVLYEMLSGRPPFDAPSLGQLLVKHATEAPAPLAFAGGLEELALGLLSKQPAARAPSAAAIVEEIDGLVLDWSGVSRTLGPGERKALGRSISGAGRPRSRPTAPLAPPAALASPPVPLTEDLVVDPPLEAPPAAAPQAPPRPESLVTTPTPGLLMDPAVRSISLPAAAPARAPGRFMYFAIGVALGAVAFLLWLWLASHPAI